MTSNRYTLNTYIKPGLKLGSKVRKISIDSYFQKLQRGKKKKDVWKQFMIRKCREPGKRGASSRGTKEVMPISA